MNQSFRVQYGVRAAAIIGVALLGLLSAPNRAQADPHAMFYTVSGQQQLFFNTLAALDQADYVEPQTDRQRILDTRGNPETDPELKSTETKQASILTRGITLEGQDLWSVYQKFQLGLEVARRQDTAALLTYFCQRSLGLKDCKENAEAPNIAEGRKQASFNTRPLQSERAVKQAGLDIGYSGDAVDQQQRRDLITGKSFDPTNDKAYNASIAHLQQEAANDPQKATYLSQLTSRANSLSFGQPDPSAFDNLTVDTDGQVTLPRYTTTSQVTSKLAALVSLPNQFLEARMAAENRRREINNQTTVNGAKADTYPIPKVQNGQIGEIEGGVRVPAYIKASQGTSLAEGLSKLATDPKYVGEENIPGKVQLVNGAGPADQGGNVQGASTTASSSARVLGTTDNLQRPVDEGDPLPEQKPGPEINSNVNVVRSLDEGPFRRLLEQLEGGSNRGGCRCSIDDLLRSYGSDILGRDN